ncbi:MAG: uracil-DNA glycosylase [Planctomycetaceae bacterium]|nr:uracil-DNA glycosylase [Planctomycetaceae bacterium]
MNLNRAIEQTLQSWKRAGLVDFPHSQEGSLLTKLNERALSDAPGAVVEPQQLTQQVTPSEAKSVIAAAIPVEVENRVLTIPTGQQDVVASEIVNETELVNENSAGNTEMNLKQRTARLQDLSEQVAACTKCAELAAGRTQTVFGVGNPRAKVMFIGEAPGADEDKQGEPFVGRAGKLLNTIIEACGWTREELYICNILRCRPDGNRNPTPIEAGNCREYLDGQIEAVNPKYIVCWGTIAAQNLLGESTPIGRMRGQFYNYGKAKVLCTYHPSYLLRNPPAKKFVWEDMKILLREMGIDPDEIAKKKSD